MLPIWFLYASYMLPICFLYGSYMLPIWFLYASYMVPICFLYGSYMLPIWFLYASHMLPICFVYVNISALVYTCVCDMLVYSKWTNLFVGHFPVLMMACKEFSDGPSDHHSTSRTMNLSYEAGQYTDAAAGCCLLK